MLGQEQIIQGRKNYDLIQYFANFKNLDKIINLQLIIRDQLDSIDSIFELNNKDEFKYKFFNSKSLDKLIISSML